MKVSWFLSAKELSDNLKDHVRSLTTHAHHKPGRFAGNLKKKLSNRSSEILWYPSKKVPGPLFNPPKKKPFKRGLGHRRCNMGLILKGGPSQGVFPTIFPMKESRWWNDEMGSFQFVFVDPSIHYLTYILWHPWNYHGTQNWCCRCFSLSKEYKFSGSSQ